MLGDAPDRDARVGAMFCHLSGLAIVTCIPFANVIAPLIIWLIKREESPYIDGHGKEAFNFQVSIAIYFIVAGLFSMVYIGIPFMFAVFVADLYCILQATLHANDGQPYRYPITIRFVK